MSADPRAEPLRLLIVDEGVLGHRTLKGQLAASLEAMPGVELRMVTVPPPSRLGARLLRRIPRLGDADLLGLRWRLRWSWQARRLLKRHAGWADAALVITQASALLSKGPMRRLPCVLSVDATIGQFTALEYLGPRDRHSARQQRLLARLEQRAIAGAAAVVPWTEWNAAALREEYEIEADAAADDPPRAGRRVVGPGGRGARNRTGGAAASPLRRQRRWPQGP